MKTKRLRCLVSVSLSVLLSSLLCFAQSTTGIISGTVTDQSKGVIPGVTITVKNTDTGAIRNLVTDEAGRYQVLSLPPGTFEVAAELSGFSKAIRRGVSVTIGKDTEVDIQLSVGQLSEQVIVEAERTELDRNTAVVGGVVTTNQIAELPLNGRSFMQLATLQPGVNVSRGTARDFTGGFGNTQISIGGGRPEHTGYLLEGTNIADISDKAPSSMAGVLLGVDTVREFSVQTHGYSAEFGRAAGGIISAVTKSGTNQLHGSLFEFHRNSALDARNFFDEEKVPPFIRNQFGATVGGPIVKNNLFFFGSYEGLRERLAITQLARLPNKLAHEGRIPDGKGGLENVGVHPEIKPYLDLLFPIPTGRDFGDGTAELRHSGSNPTDEDYFVGKLDWNIGANDSAFARFSSDVSDTSQIQENPLFSEVTGTKTKYVTLQEQHLFSPRVLNEFRAALNRTVRTDILVPNIDIPKSLFFTKDPQFGNINFSQQPITSIGATATLPVLYVQNLFEYADTLTWHRGRHNIKFGMDVQRYQFQGFSNSRFGGEFRFRNLREFLTRRRSSTAVADRFTGNLPGTNNQRYMRQSYWAFFVHDDFRISNRLAMSLGLRYEFVTTPYEMNGKVAGLLSLNDLESGPNGVTPGSDFFKNPSKKGFAPRLGLAWDPFGDGKTSVRSSFGIFYQPLTVSFYRGTTFRIFPFFAGVDIRNPTVFGPAIQPVLDQGTGLRVQKRSEFILYDIQQPYVMHYHLQVEHEFKGGIVAKLGYLGSRGNHLPFYGDPNAVPAERLSNGEKRVIPGAKLRYPSWGRIRTRKTDAQSFYNSLIAGVTARFAKNLQLQGSYTLSKSIDDWSGGQIGGNDFDNGQGSATDWWDRTAERGLSSFDVRHNFVFNGVYQLPWGRSLTGAAGALAKGWQVGTIVTIAGGIPFTPFIGFDRAGDQQSDSDLQKPTLAPGRSNNPVIGSVDNWFDVTAFILPERGFYGNLGRNTITGPNLRTLDLSVLKNTTVREGMVVQFRAEAFNILNRANFATPNISGLFNPNGSRQPAATQITRTATTSRQIQFGLKILF